MKKVLFLANIPSPYRVDFWNELGKYCDLTVWFEADNEKNREWNIEGIGVSFKYKFLRSFTINLTNHISFEILGLLIRNSFDFYIIGGYSSFTEMLAIGWLRLGRKTFIINADGGFPKKEKAFSFYIKKLLISSASYWLSSGINCTKYLVHYGATPKNIIEYPFSAGYFYESKGLLKPETRKEYKDRLNLSGKVILTVGQFIHRKGIDVLLDAYSKSSLRNSAMLVIVGGGPLKDQYLEFIEKNSLNGVKIVDFLDKSELSAYYKAADVFVLPTRYDVWGLVINEAMSYGLPVIASSMAGAAYSLVDNDKNGYIFETGNSSRLSEILDKMLCDDYKLRTFGEQSFYKISNYTIKKMVKAHTDFFEVLQP